MEALCSSGVQGFFEGATAGTFKFIGQKMTARKTIKAPGFEKIHSEAKNPYEILERRGIPTTLSQEERAAFDAVGLEMKYKPSGMEPNLEMNTGNRPPNMTPQGAGRRGAFREAKRRNGIPVSEQPIRVGDNFNKQGKKVLGKQYEFENGTIIRDDAEGHVYLDDPTQNRGPHFNDNRSNNHYDY